VTQTLPRCDTVALMGVELDRLTRAQAVARVGGALDGGHGGAIVTPNLDHLRLASTDPSLRTLIADADLAVADGMPLIWASRLLGDPLPERVPGSGLIWDLCEDAGKNGRSVLLIGGAGAAGARAAAVIAARYPGLEECRHLPLPMGFEPEELGRVEPVREAVEASGADLVFVGLGFPKQERLIAALRPALPGAWFAGVGISLSFVAGEVRRAPPWVQSLGLEWVHRLIQEPRRLARRYLLYGIPFAIRLFRHALRRRFA
jgi:N-acetylglucosaminyldiphosphoundecaprenol N-acetyl-beta-D-mannosaminyltransferase